MVYFRKVITTKPNQYDEFLNRWSRIRTLVPKRMYMLMFMIEGFDDYPSWSSYRGTRRGGTGQAALNCEGGFGLDTVVKKMIRDGEVTLSRYQSHNNVHGGNPTINRTRITVTQRGREVYLAWKKRMGKRLGLT